jgi:hypothetical protein
MPAALSQRRLRQSAMNGDRIPDEMKAFISDYINSVVQLELLILLYHRRDDTWTPEQVAGELRISEGWTATELSRLAARGLVAAAQGPPRSYRYAPPPELELPIARLVETYGERRVSIINLIYSGPGGALRSFADAFRLRKG